MKFSNVLGNVGLFRVCLAVSFVLLLTSCGGGGSSTPPPAPIIEALLFSFPTGVAPANFANAMVNITDGYTSANITNASVTMNGVPLTYNGATTHQEYEGNLLINPGDTVTLVVNVGGKTFTSSGTQFSSYPSISAPVSGATWSASSVNTVTWSGGAPLTSANYVLGVLDATDPSGGSPYFQFPPTGTTSFSIPAYYSVSAGSRDLIVGIMTHVSIPKADANSFFIIGGFDYVPVTVTGMPITSRTPSATNSLEGVAWSGSKFVAVGSSGTILTSTDKVTWTPSTSGTTNSLHSITWSGTQFVVVGDSGTILTSPDGITWTSHTAGTYPLFGVAWSGTQFVAVGFYGNIFTSPDGITWTLRNAGNDSNVLNGALQSVTWSGSQYVAVGRAGVILTSPNGITWTTQTSGASTILQGITWSGTQFVVVGYDLGSCCTDVILTSPDGVTWTPRSSGANALPNAVAWSGSEFVAVGGPAVNGTILTSPDGITWTQQASGTTNHLYGISWTGTEFVIVGEGNTILTSP